MRLQNDFGRCTHNDGIIGHIHISHNRVGRNHHPMANVTLPKHFGVRCSVAIVADNREFVLAIERANTHNHARREMYIVANTSLAMHNNEACRMLYFHALPHRMETNFDVSFL